MSLPVFDRICLDVSEFNYLFGVINYNYNPLETQVFINLFDKSNLDFNEIQVKLRFNLIKEESFELIDAFEKKDTIEIIDALADILYVVAGAKVYFNLDNKNINYKIGQNNLDLELEQNPSLNHTIIDEIKEIIINNNENKLTNMLEDLKYYIFNLQNLTEEILHRYEQFDISVIDKYNNILDHITLIVFKISQEFKINIFELFVLVHKSNMTKVCLDAQTAISTVQWYSDNERRYKTPNYRVINYNNKQYWVIYDEETKKILKSINYSPVKFI